MSAEETEKKNFDSRLAMLVGLASLLSVLAAGGVWVLNHFFLDPRERQIANLEAEQRRLNTENRQNQRLGEELQQKLDAVLRNIERPSLHKPAFDDQVIGHSMSLAWNYPGHDPYQTYVVELRRLPLQGDGAGALQPAEFYNALDPETQSFVIDSLTGSHEFLWRVIPGRLVYGEMSVQGRIGSEAILPVPDGHLIVQGPGSPYNRFTAFETVVERIRATGTLVVGISPSRLSAFRRLMPTGELRGHDITLMAMIADELGRRLTPGNDVRLRYVDFTWKNLLPNLRQHRVDLVISSMTATRKRERDNGIVFSTGYFTTHQTLVAGPKNQRCSLDDLEGARVGVSAATTNQSAAEFLQESREFSLDSSYSGYDPLEEALNVGEIDFAVVDDVQVLSKIEEGRLVQCGENLDAALSVDLTGTGSFFDRQIGFERERYAIAAADEGTPSSLADCQAAPADRKSLVCHVNEILASERGRQTIEGIDRTVRAP